MQLEIAEKNIGDLQSKLSDEDSLAILETAFRQISHETEPEIRSKISALVANSVLDKNADAFWIRKFLKIIDGLIFPEIAWLEYFAVLEGHLYCNDEFRREELEAAMAAHKTRLSTLHLISPPESPDVDLQEIQKSFTKSLINHDLVTLDGHDHRLEDYRLTHLGKLLVRFIWVPNELRNLRKKVDLSY